MVFPTVFQFQDKQDQLNKSLYSLFLKEQAEASTAIEIFPFFLETGNQTEMGPVSISS